ncbi:MAG TPA: hypothetical protein VLE20_09350 [Blastocatellia bacterium]|jgi:hypothetical protein|nr:hypothetical protein [Blastocatellia bacterium]
MVARILENSVAPEYLRLIVLGFGLSHTYRVLGFDEIAHGLPHLGRTQLKETLESLANEGLVTRFSGRFCFNKTIPPELRKQVESVITPSGTVRARELTAL